MPKEIKLWYWFPKNNFGDILSKVIVEWLAEREVKLAQRGEGGKMIAVGSIIHTVKSGDVVWGTGWKGDKIPAEVKEAKVLAVRGPLTRDAINEAGGKSATIYGDPALLMPLIYQPKIKEKIYDVGYIPHYIEDNFTKPDGNCVVIDILGNWQTIIDQIVSCRKVVSSSLHGIIVAEAYGVPCEWAVWGNKIVGGRLKYDDYFLGTNRPVQEPFTLLPPIDDLRGIQSRLVKAFNEWYAD